MASNIVRSKSVVQKFGKWSPSKVDLVAWYDASDTTTITEAGGSVSQWDDKSSNGYHMIQASSSHQPLTAVATLGGKNVISFDSDLLVVSIAAGTFPTSMQVTGVIQKTGVAGTNEVFFARSGFLNPAPLNRWRERLYVGDNTTNTFITTTNINTLTSPTIISTMANTTDAKEWLDGTNTVDQAHGFNYGDTAATLALGTFANLANDHFEGYMGEIIVSTELSDADRQKLEGYLAWKWGLVSNLPVSHPYKNTPPTSN